MLSSDPASSFEVSDSSSSFEESSSSSFDGFFIDFGSSGSTFPTMWYNVPDGLERNPDVIRAEISLMTTPISQAFAEEAYEAVKNVQDVCAVDYKSFCSSNTYDLAAVTSFLDNFMTPTRLLTETQNQGDGLKMLNKVRSYYRKLDNKAIVMPKKGAHIKTANLRSVNRQGGRVLEGPRGPPPRGPPPEGDRPPRGPPPRGPPEDGRPPRGPPPPPSEGVPEPAFWGPPPPPEESESDVDHQDMYEVSPPPPPAPWEDVYFNGALGFGAEGDLCLYENFNQLSQPCVDSVAELYDVRQRFWHDSEESIHGHHFFVIVLAALALWMLVKRCMMRKHIKKVHTFLQAIRENPALKATIEAETGLTVPELPCKHHKSCSEKDGEKQCCLKRFCKCFATFVFVFVVSFFMAFTSLEITSNILVNWDADAAANGDENGTSPVVALLLLLTITLTEITIFAVAVKLGKCLCAYISGESCDTSSSAPSAPPASPTVVIHTTPSSPRRLWKYSRAYLNSMFSSRHTHDDYTPLNGGDETEMVTVIPSAAVPQYVVMTAAPVTRVNMV